jgi:transcriptional regulator with XRE-family HTH domain
MKKDNIAKIIGANIRKYRELRNISRGELAELLGIDIKYIGAVERGESLISLTKIIDLTEILGIEISNIIPSRSGENLVVESYGITTDEVAKLLPDLSSNQLLAVQSFIRSISHLK